MIGTDIERPPNNGIDERSVIIQEYEAIVEGLQQDLKGCREEQIHLRAEVEALKNENQTAAEIARTSFSHTNNTECPRTLEDRKCIENLKKQITLLQLEKDSIFQLWQMALKTVDTLEQEIKTSQSGGRAHAYYEEQVNHVKETYSEAIKALEAKLIQAKENFVKHQSLWESCRDRVEALNTEKAGLERKIQNLQNDVVIKEESYKKIIENFNSSLEGKKRELEASKSTQSKLESELVEARCLATRMAAKDQESKHKVAEAIELVETAMREKEEIMQREAAIVEEKSKLEAQMRNLVEEFAMKLEKQLAEAKETFDRNSKKYILEIKELKSELREKATLLDRAQREYRMLEEELEKIKYGSEDFLQRSGTKVMELEKKLKEAEEKLLFSEETTRRKFEEKLRLSESRILELEDKLSTANDRLRKTQIFGSREMEDRVREADDRVKEAIDRYSAVEKRLTRALDERENIASELRNLQLSFDREMSRKDNERRLLEGRIRELQEDLRRANDVAEKAGLRINCLNTQVESLETELEGRKSQIINKNGDIEVALKKKSSDIKILQEKYEDKIVELANHVKIHQKLSNKWKEEAQLLANKFQLRYKELRQKAHVLEKDNELLNRELAMCRQQVASCRNQIMQSADNDAR